MARKKKGQKKLEDWLDYEYEREYTWECPVRGTVTQMIKVKRIKSRLVEQKYVISSDDDDAIVTEDYSDDIEYIEN